MHCSATQRERMGAVLRYGTEHGTVVVAIWLTVMCCVGAVVVVVQTGTQGIRPLLSVVTGLSALVQVLLGVGAVREGGCTLVGSYLLCVGAASGFLFVALQVLPWVEHSTACALVGLRRALYVVSALLAPTFVVLNILGGRWVHVDDCWDSLPLRNLTLLDAIVIDCVIILALWYTYTTFVQQHALAKWGDQHIRKRSRSNSGSRDLSHEHPSGRSTRSGCRNGRVCRCAMATVGALFRLGRAIGRHARLLLFMGLASVAIANLIKLREHHAGQHN